MQSLSKGPGVGGKDRPTTEELAEIETLKKEVADQARTIEILKAATQPLRQGGRPAPDWYLQNPSMLALKPLMEPSKPSPSAPVDAPCADTLDDAVTFEPARRCRLAI
jgi:hypothetical protein